MTRALVDRIADAVLYEGYILYPYRPSVKNRQRWTFGALYPEAYCQGQTGSDSSWNQTECLVRGGAGTIVEATVRFLHLTSRRVGEVAPPLAEWPDAEEPAFRLVEAQRVGDRVFQTWQEAEERTVALPPFEIPGCYTPTPARQRGAAPPVAGAPGWSGAQGSSHRLTDFALHGRRWLEPIRDEAGLIVGVLLREQQALAGSAELSCVPLAADLLKLTLRIRNDTPLHDAEHASRDDALLRSLVSAHAVLCVRGGAFVSLLDPPEGCREPAAGCRNVGVWPVLVGEEGQADTMLSSPIILYDYPQVAPESPGDLFDSTEIDEILTLRILTLTDEEKRQAAGVDECARALLARTESLADEQILRLHGTVRSLRPLPEGDDAHG